MNKFMKIGLGILALAVLYFVVSSLFFEAMMRKPVDDVVFLYRGSVVELDDELTFKLGSHDQRLKLGYVKVVDATPENMERIQEVMTSDELSCSSINIVSPRDRIESDLVSCNFSSDTSSVIEKLLAEDLVVEDCDQSKNRFGTCTDDVSEGELTKADLAVYTERVATLNKEMTDYQIRLATRNEEMTDSDENMLQAALELENSPEAIGTYKGREVELAYACWGDLCPHNGAYFLRYVSVAKEDCEQMGGYIVEGFNGWGGMAYGGCSPVERPISDQAY